jgi:hypothetical protein
MARLNHWNLEVPMMRVLRRLFGNSWIMTMPHDSSTWPNSSRRWLYMLLLALQTIGVVVFYFKGLPLYREVASDPTAYIPKASTWAWSLPAIALIQVGYWIPHRVGPSTPRFVNVVLGHVALFIGRLIFLLPVAFFSFVFINNKLENKMPFSRYVLLLAGLFSLFCYSLDLRRYGTALIGPDKRTDAAS